MEKVRIWCGGEDALPTVYMHSVAGDGHCVWEACRRIGCPDFNLVSIYDFDFDGDLTPWPAQGVRKRQPPFKGNAKSHLAEMLAQNHAGSGGPVASQAALQRIGGIFIGRTFRPLERLAD